MPQPVPRIGSQKIVRQLTAQIPWDRFLYRLNNKWGRIDILKELRRKTSLISSEEPRANLCLGLFSRSGFKKGIEALGKKGEIELIDVRKIGL